MANLIAFATAPETRQIRLRIRINIDKDNSTHVHSLIEQLSSLGLAGRVEIDLAIVVLWSERKLGLMERPLFADNEVAWMSHLVYRGFAVTFLPAPKATPCLAADPNAFVVAATGTIHNCAMTPYAPHSVTPSTSDLGVLGEYNSQLLQSRHEDIFEMLGSGKYPCTECSFLFLCQGGCPKDLESGLLPCPSYKFNIHERMQLQVLATNADHRTPRIKYKSQDSGVPEDAIRVAVEDFQKVFAPFRCPDLIIEDEESCHSIRKFRKQDDNISWIISLNSHITSPEQVTVVALESLAICYLAQINPELVDCCDDVASEIVGGFSKWATHKVLRQVPDGEGAIGKIATLSGFQCIEHFLSLAAPEMFSNWGDLDLKAFGLVEHSRVSDFTIIK